MAYRKVPLETEPQGAGVRTLYLKLALKRKILMEVSVQFFGAQRTLTRTRNLQVKLPEHGRVSDVCLYLKDRYPDLPLNEDDILITVNNMASGMNHILSQNDHITFLPHVGGG